MNTTTIFDESTYDKLKTNDINIDAYILYLKYLDNPLNYNINENDDFFEIHLQIIQPLIAQITAESVDSGAAESVVGSIPASLEGVRSSAAESSVSGI